jgi:hypothetical protein
MTSTGLIPACMACTMVDVPPSDPSIPFPLGDASVCFAEIDEQVVVLPSREYMCDLMSRSQAIVRPITSADIFPRAPKYYSYNVPRMNVNKKSRKYHNIRQPGGASDDQRRRPLR